MQDSVAVSGRSFRRSQRHERAVDEVQLDGRPGFVGDQPTARASWRSCASRPPRRWRPRARRVVRVCAQRVQLRVEGHHPTGSADRRDVIGSRSRLASILVPARMLNESSITSS